MACTHLKTLAALISSLIIAFPGARAAEIEEEMYVIGDPENLEKIPGSGEIVDKDELEASRVFTVNEALRKVSGVNVRDEEGFGLRPNVGIRGLNPTRSTKITLLEDGIPLSYAPYGDNASYYHPPIDRYSRIEVLKGAGLVAYGPQTLGGLINYITPTPPREFASNVSTTTGNRGYMNVQAQAGGNGMLIDYTRKQGDGARDNVESELNDLNFKYVSSIDASQALTVRVNLYSEDSDLTYSGLTDTEYSNFGPEYNPFKNDEFETDRKGASLTHDWLLDEEAQLTTNLYYSNFNRDWWRQSSSTSDGQCGAGFTNARLAGQEVDPDTCNSAQGRLRSYYTHGVEPRLKLTHRLFGVTSELETGVRIHFEEQNRVQRNGTSPTARTGTVVEDNVRETEALSAFVMNRFLLGQWTVTPGVRIEQIDSERTNKLPGGVSGSDTLDVTIPSLGITWNPTEALTVFAGAHKGFAPPRTEDVVNGVGISTEVEAEESTNLELGLRVHADSMDELQVTWFRNDFESLTAVGSIAGGSTPLAQGEALFEGLEISGLFNVMDTVYLRGAYTNLREAEQTTPFRQVVDDSIIAGSEAGNRQPYAPEDMFTAAIGCTQGAFEAQLEAVYVGKQFSDFANTEEPLSNGNGQLGKLDDYTIWNAAISFTLEPQNIDLFITVKNLADEVYIVDRTRGILPGAPRLVQAGASFSF